MSGQSTLGEYRRDCDAFVAEMRNMFGMMTAMWDAESIPDAAAVLNSYVNNRIPKQRRIIWAGQPRETIGDAILREGRDVIRHKSGYGETLIEDGLRVAREHCSVRITQRLVCDILALRHSVYRFMKQEKGRNVGSPEYAAKTEIWVDEDRIKIIFFFQPSSADLDRNFSKLTIVLTRRRQSDGAKLVLYKTSSRDEFAHEVPFILERRAEEFLATRILRNFILNIGATPIGRWMDVRENGLEARADAMFWRRVIARTTIFRGMRAKLTDDDRDYW